MLPIPSSIFDESGSGSLNDDVVAATVEVVNAALN